MALARERAVNLVRPRSLGKFLFVGEQKLWIRGVTYGTFRPRDGAVFPCPSRVDRDFAGMAEAGFNAVRVYTVPPRWVLDAASRYALRMMIGLPWEQHVGFLDEAAMPKRVEEAVRQGVRSCAGHPAVLCYAIGNEIPASIVRWSGARRVRRFLARLHDAVRREDPGALVTYVSYPSTEYLSVPFVDFLCFNVYLEDRERLRSYLARLHSIAGERPLVLGEIGLDSRRNGEDRQARSLSWQVRAAFEGGCAGAFVYAWTDEWHRGGHDIDDWDFGLTRRDRSAKPALREVAQALQRGPVSVQPGISWPKVSVVVCSYNGAATIEETLTALQEIDYPDYEVIVVDDGSTDATADIAARYAVRLIRTPNRGLSNARNTGLHSARGDIVAYIDDDAYPDRDWLSYLVLVMEEGGHAGGGGPNIAPPGDGIAAACIANAPGGPLHVLLRDDVAEHVPGCNMAFRRDALLSIGGFDPQFRIAGDDVDVCWRIQAAGGTIGFHAAAMVWHHRRNSIRRYLRQQWFYAKAEAALAEKWPQKYNGAGYLGWHGRIYGRGLPASLFKLPRIYHGTWGSAPFQSLYQPSPGLIAGLPLMPEWYFLMAVTGGLGVLGASWAPLSWALVPAVTMLAVSLAQAVLGGARASLRDPELGRLRRAWCRLVVALLHLLQPLVRLLGRVKYRLGPWRRRRAWTYGLVRPREAGFWSETWQPHDRVLSFLERRLHHTGARVLRGGEYDRWDLFVNGGLFGGVRVHSMVEEHGGGRQMFRFRLLARPSRTALALAAALGVMSVGAVLDQAWTAGAALAVMALGLLERSYTDCAAAASWWRTALGELEARATGHVPREELTPSHPQAGNTDSERVPDACRSRASAR